jgi:hypothetical protein
MRQVPDPHTSPCNLVASRRDTRHLQYTFERVRTSLDPHGSDGADALTVTSPATYPAIARSCADRA